MGKERKREQAKLLATQGPGLSGVKKTKLISLSRVPRQKEKNIVW